MTTGPRKSRRREAESDGSPWLWLANPRNVVFLILVTVLGVGGGRRWLQAWRARRAIARLDDSDVSPAEVESVGEYGRAGLHALFELLSNAPREDIRLAAGSALYRIWAADDLVAEEEQAVVRRLFAVDWKARRVYPRALKRPIPIELSFGPRLVSRALSATLQQSCRITGTRQATFERDSPWKSGPGSATVTIDPEDFPTDGPHRLVLQPKLRTDPSGKHAWAIELPHSPFTIEFDPRLLVDSLLSHLDESRREMMERGVSLVEAHPGPPIDLGDRFVLNDPPRIEIAPGLPCDLAHQANLEIEGVAGPFAAGEVLAVGAEGGSFALGAIQCPSDTLERPGEYRLRLHLTPDAGLGWTHPRIRSIWPGTIVTEWAAVTVLRR